MIGQTISHFRIDRKLGAGGMGEVYQAEDTNLKRQVALKVLSKQLATDPDGRNKIVKEAQTASRLTHPNIATVYEVDVAGETPFIAMELVGGQSLKELLEQRSLRPDELAKIARQVAEGLAEAHAGGVLHRDIKPGNVMVDARGRVKVLDFGLAVLTQTEREAGEDEDQFVSRTATKYTTGGTVPFMAPEQLRGAMADARSDIFSFGVMLYQCLAGRLPFDGETSIDILHSILHNEPRPIRTLVPDISPVWERLIERCLAKAPEQRPASMAEVIDALKKLETSGSAQQEKSLAVLYFENLSRSEDDEYFRDGITEDIITELSRIEGLKVFSRSAVIGFRDKDASSAEVGRKLGATHVLEGSLRRAGKRLRITGRLVETRTGHSVWAERYDRQLEDVFEIQDEISQSIGGALQVMLGDQKKAAPKKKEDTPDVRAYDLYLRGRQFFHQFRRQGYEFARQMFARAIVIDANYARAYAGVADCCSFLYMYFDSSEANLEEADAASKRAVELEPDLAEAHASRGLAASLRREYDQAAEEFETAIRLDPKLFEAHYFYARARFAEGKVEDAATLFARASEVSPEDYQAPIFLAQCYKALKRDADATAAYRNSLNVIKSYHEMHPDDPRPLYLGAAAFCALGEKEPGLEWLARSLEIDPDDPGVLYNVGCVYASFGEADKSLDCLERATSYREWMENDPDLDSLRDHPRFQAIFEKL